MDDVGQLEQALASGALPSALIPCDLAGVLLAADVLRAHAQLLEQAAASLARVEVTSWRGPAATGFADDLGGEPPRWRRAADGFLAGALALEGFVASIGPAREQASVAAGLYRAYLKATASAAAVAAVPAVPGVPPYMQVGVRIVQQQQAAAVGGPAAALVADAERLRVAAVTTLATARGAVEGAGDVAASAVGRAAAEAPDARRFWEATIRPADIVGTGHAALDVTGMLPGVGAVPDGVNAAWYAVSGDMTSAAISAAGMVPIFGDAIIGGRLVRNVTRPLSKFTDGVANPMPKRLYISGSDSPDNLSPRPRDNSGLSSFDNTDAPIFRPESKVQEVDPTRLKDLGVFGPDGPNGHHSIRPLEASALAEWMSARGSGITHPYTQELIDSIVGTFKMPKQ